MNFFKQTTLIGIGLIGSSIARALKKKKVTKKICIFSRTERTINKAKKLKLGNFYTNDLEKSVEGSDLIIICTPLSTYKNILDKISNHIMPNTILTDVGSAKLNAVKIFSKLKNVKFNILPAHPIAGTEKSGPESGFAELFYKKCCLLTPYTDTDKVHLDKVVFFWEELGMFVDIMSPEMHDLVLATISHLPHLVAFNLVDTASKLENKKNYEVTKYAAGDFLIIRGLHHRIQSCGEMFF